MIPRKTLATVCLGACLTVATLGTGAAANAAPAPTPTRASPAPGEARTPLASTIESLSAIGGPQHRTLLGVVSGVPADTDFSAWSDETQEYSSARSNSAGRLSFSADIDDRVVNHVNLQLKSASYGDRFTFDYDDSRPVLSKPSLTTASANADQIGLTIEGLPGAQFNLWGGGSALGGVLSAEGRADVVLPRRDHEVTYSATLQAAGELSVTGDIVTDAGVGSASPNAPSITGIDRQDGRMIVNFKAEPRSLVTVRDESGATIARRLVGNSGVISVPVPAAIGQRAFVTLDGADSAETSIDVPPAS